jgi:hypothetical protein
VETRIIESGVEEATQIDFLPSKSGENLVLQFLPDFVSYQEIAITGAIGFY